MTTIHDYRKDVPESFNARRAVDYRRLDEAAITGQPSYQHYAHELQTLTQSFGRPIDVLDVGCGSGRFFHCLRSVRRLVGIDLSPAMLDQARHPVRADQISALSTELVCGDVTSLALSPQFDFIYSIGVLGEYSPFDSAVLGRLTTLLAPGGAIFLTVVESASRISEPESGQLSLRRRAARKLFPLLPRFLRATINSRLSPFYLGLRQAERIFGSSSLERISITPYAHQSGWRGTHLDCKAYARDLHAATIRVVTATVECQQT